jgi:hypothetical protein
MLQYLGVEFYVWVPLYPRAGQCFFVVGLWTFAVLLV